MCACVYGYELSIWLYDDRNRSKYSTEVNGTTADNSMHNGELVQFLGFPLTTAAEAQSFCAPESRRIGQDRKEQDRVKVGVGTGDEISWDAIMGQKNDSSKHFSHAPVSWNYNWASTVSALQH